MPDFVPPESSRAAPPPMKRVVVESPYAGDIEANIAYARMCVADCLRRGESPIASHLLLTQPGVLDDANPAQRALGIDAGHAWIGCADVLAVYLDRGMSAGMRQAVVVAARAGVRIDYRRFYSGTESTEAHDARR